MIITGVSKSQRLWGSKPSCNATFVVSLCRRDQKRAVSAVSELSYQRASSAPPLFA